MMEELGKIVIISDVHGRILDMLQFFQQLLKKEKIAFGVHLGDFWSGRNFDPARGTQTKSEWTDLSFFRHLPFPLFHLRGNEDLTQPEDWWNTENMWLMRDQEPFYLMKWKALPIDYQFPGETAEEKPKHPEFKEQDHIEIILSHRPPLNLLDDTLHYETHKKLSQTGSPVVRYYYDHLHPALTIFGHFHYSNMLRTEYGLVLCLDKLIRTGTVGSTEYRYSYGLLDPSDQSLEVFWKSKPFFKYSILEQKFIYTVQSDKRDLYRSRKKNWHTNVSQQQEF